MVETHDVKTGGDEALAQRDVPQHTLRTDAHDQDQRATAGPEYVIRELESAGQFGTAGFHRWWQRRYVTLVPSAVGPSPTRAPSARAGGRARSGRCSSRASERHGAPGTPVG